MSAPPSAPTAVPPGQPNQQAGGDSPVDTGTIKNLRKRADDLETKLNVASENGLFSHQTKVSHLEILGGLTVAFRLTGKAEMTADEYSKTIEALDTAQNKYDTAIQEVGFRRRFVYVYGGPVLIYLLGVLAFIVVIVLFPPPYLSTVAVFLAIPKKMLLAGSVGSILRGVKALWSDVDAMVYRKFWTTWYVLCPFMGALLGGIVYLAFFVGVATTTLSTSITNPALALFIAILAGYNWEWARDVLENAVKILRGEKSSE